ncbi:ABC transporter permease [Actinoplanes sp. RD1]|uniref:ABC transporter permease n=1 Tax=Actinoplanes sp. RD1 TaxID=3064538 RepID=UPI00274145C5|nr:ABC transporter permease [Actinoplanes sp. RD1]
MTSRPALTGTLVLARFEVVALLRSPLAVVNAVLSPVALGAGWLALAGRTGRGTDGDAAGMLLVFVLSFVTYAGATTALAARRADLVLIRLRATALPTPGIIAGLVAPFLLVSVVQLGLLTAVAPAAGTAAPHRWWPLILALALGSLVAVALAFATAAYTPAPELAQLTTTPGVLAFAGGALALLNLPDAGRLLLIVPGAALTDLTRAAWTDDAPVWPSALALAVTSAAALALAARVFRWEPRR